MQLKSDVASSVAVCNMEFCAYGIQNENAHGQNKVDETGRMTMETMETNTPYNSIHWACSEFRKAEYTMVFKILYMQDFGKSG